MRSIASLALALVMTATAAAQITVPAKVELGQPIVAQFTGQPPIAGGKSSIAWTSETLQLVTFDQNRAGAWGLPGKHQLACSALYTVLVFTPDPAAPDDPTKAKLTELTLPPYHYSATVEIVSSEPLPPPEPPKPPTPEKGKRQLVIIRESQDDTDDFKRAVVGVQAGKLLESRGNPPARVYDDDDLPASLKSRIGQLPAFPAVFVIDPATGAVVYHGTLPPTATAQDIVQIVIQAGG